MTPLIRRLFGSLRRSSATGAALAAARQLLEADQPRQALPLLEELLERDPEHSEALYLRGTVKLEMRRPAEALPDLLRSVEIDPAHAQRHFNIALAHWQLSDVARCQASLREALRLDPNFDRAHRFLAGINLHGPIYLDVLERLHALLRPRTYLEIGIHRGESFALARRETRALGVDPEPRLQHPPGPNQRVFAQTSDEFFTRHDVRAELGGLPLDLAFIDGMHLFEFALRDFMHVEPLCAPESTVLVHDVYPLDRETATRERNTTFWTGDVWRLIILLKEHRPDLSIHTVAAPPSGIAVIRRLDPASRVIIENLDRLIDRYSAFDYSAIESGKAEALNLYANDWDAVARLFERDPP